MGLRPDAIRCPEPTGTLYGKRNCDDRTERIDSHEKSKGYPLGYPLDCRGGVGPQSGPGYLGVSVTGLGENREPVSDQLNRISLALLGIVGILADPADDVNQIALVGFGGTLNVSAK